MAVAKKAGRYCEGLQLNSLASSILCWKWQRRPAVVVPWTAICGLMLFTVVLISLFTGHVASDLEWYSQHLVKRTWYYKLKNVTSMDTINLHDGEAKNSFCDEEYKEDHLMDQVSL